MHAIKPLALRKRCREVPLSQFQPKPAAPIAQDGAGSRYTALFWKSPVFGGHHHDPSVAVHVHPSRSVYIFQALLFLLGPPRPLPRPAQVSASLGNEKKQMDNLSVFTEHYVKK
eukprot:1160632-Pelagomonas_calceolata.AAC.14